MCYSKIESKGHGMSVLFACGVYSYLVSFQGIIAEKLEGDKWGECGVQASDNLLHRDPWLVFLEFYRRGQLTEIRCAGTLVSRRHVLTAAHCVGTIRYNRLKARLGEYDVSLEVDCVEDVCANSLVRIRIQDVLLHPGFDGKEHDIAILTLAEDAPYTDFIRPVCLPSRNLQTAATFHAAGWGELVSTGDYSNIKKTIPLPFFPKDQCVQAYKHDVIPEHTICAGGEIGIDTCRGDSGGPLIWVGDTAQIWGVTSLGSNVCGRVGKPGIYTNVRDYLDWIEEGMKLR